MKRFLLVLILSILWLTEAFALTQQSAINQYLSDRKLDLIEGIWMNKDNDMFVIYKSSGSNYRIIVISAQRANTGEYFGNLTKSSSNLYTGNQKWIWLGVFMTSYVDVRVSYHINGNRAKIRVSDNNSSATRYQTRIWPSSISDHNANVDRKKRQEAEAKRKREEKKRAEEKRKKAEEARKKNEEAIKKAKEEKRKKAEKERKEKEERIREEERESEKRNKETYLKNKTYVVIFFESRRKGVFKEEQVLDNNVVLGKWTSTETEIPMTYVGWFYGSAFYSGGVLYPVQYLVCKNEELFYLNNNEPLKLNKSCDPLKIQLIDYKNYLEEERKYLEKKRKKARNRAITFLITAVLIILFFIYFVKTGRKKDVIEYNKKHKVKVKTYAELKEILAKEERRRLLEQEEREKKEELLRRKKEEAEIKKREKEELQKKKDEEKERLQEEQRLAKEEKQIDKEEISSDLGARLKKLRQMYKDGVLSKVEFEKAKNKLLK